MSGRQAAIEAVAQALRDAALLDNAGYIDGDEERAAELAVDAAEQAWPHDPPKRDPTGTTAGQFGLGPIRAPFRRDARPPRPEVPFGFAPAYLGGATVDEAYRDEKWRDAAS